MTWIKLDNTCPDHPGLVGLSDAAFACWVRGLCYASRHLTDGFLPRAALRTLGTAKAAADLVASGRWHETPEGWLIHDYEEHQRTRDEVEERRAVKGNAGTKGNHQRWHVDRGIHEPECRYCIASGSQVDRRCDAGGNRKRSPDTDTDTDTEKEPPLPPTDELTLALVASPGDDLFDEFWSAYPAKKQKGAARKAWARARRRENPHVIIAGAVRYRRDPKVLEGIVRNPATWLNGDGWCDEPSPPPRVRTIAGAASHLQARIDTTNSFLALPASRETS